MSDQRLMLEDALAQFQRVRGLEHRPLRLVIRKHNPGGLTGHQTTEIKGVYAGMDWEAGRIILEPARPLTELSPEQVEAITKSVREGGSWHAYQREKKLRDRITELENELATLRAGGPAADQPGQA